MQGLSGGWKCRSSVHCSIHASLSHPSVCTVVRRAIPHARAETNKLAEHECANPATMQRYASLSHLRAEQECASVLIQDPHFPMRHPDLSAPVVAAGAMWDEVRPFLRVVLAHAVEAATVALDCLSPLAVPSGLQTCLCRLPAAALRLAQERQCARLVTIHEVLKLGHRDRLSSRRSSAPQTQCRYKTSCHGFGGLSRHSSNKLRNSTAQHGLLNQNGCAITFTHYMPKYNASSLDSPQFDATPPKSEPAHWPLQEEVKPSSLVQHRQNPSACRTGRMANMAPMSPLRVRLHQW